jgi:formylglycine-generating enzyme required for sulfatase activity
MGEAWRTPPGVNLGSPDVRDQDGSRSDIGLFGGPDAAAKVDPLRFCDGCPAMMPISAEPFQMGGWVDYGYGKVDGPKHEVIIARPFAMAVSEVSVGEFRRFIEDSAHRSEGICQIYTEDTTWHVDPARHWSDPGFPQQDDHPVVCVSWDDAVAYIAWLNALTGQSFRLPSEAEWEYVAQTGGVGSGPGGAVTHQDANIGKAECCGGEAAGRDEWVWTAPVGAFPADRHGLHDIRGNAWEWQADCHHADYVGAPADGSARAECSDRNSRAVRGGSYGDGATYLYPQFRLPGQQAAGYFTVGFRLAHDLE